MTVFFSTLGQMGFLLLLLGIGFLLIRLRVLPENCPQILSKLENNVFVPALVLSTFINHFTLKNLTYAWQYVLCASVAVLASMAFAIVVSRFYKKEDLFTRDVITYGLAFSNFGFMGNAVVGSLFPEIFVEYLIFVLPFWIMIYVWGVPELLVPSDKEVRTVKDRLKALANPMFGAMLIGMIIAATLAKPLVGRFGKAEIGAISSLIAGVITLLLFFVRPESVWVYVAFNFFAWLGLGVFTMVSWAIITDVIDYAEIKNGIREDGSIYALYSFARKLGQAAAAGLTGLLLTLIGYEKVTGVQLEESVRRGIFDISTVVPAIGFLLLAAVLWFWYPLHKEQVNANVRILKRQREE